MHLVAAIILFIFCTDKINLYSVNANSDFDELVRGIRKKVTIEHGKTLIHEPKDVVTKFVDISLDECVWKCHSRPRCGAAQYRPTAKYCVLYRQMAGIQTFTKPGRTPGMMAIHGFENKESRTCGEYRCSVREACRFANNTFNCIFEECGNPLSGGTTHGSMYSVGSKFDITCDLLIGTLQCADTGQWWTLQGKQPGLTCADFVGSKEVHLFTNRLGITLRCDADLIIFQRRIGGYVDFYRDWDDYKYGFGNVCEEFWIGLENIHSIMNASDQHFELKIVIGDYNGTNKKALYRPFRVENEDNLFRFTADYKNSSENSEKDAGDSFSALNGSAFSTFDKDNDAMDDVNCAEEFHGAWWFGGCDQSHLNGRYYADGENEFGHGLVWKTWPGLNSSLKFARMKMRETTN